MSFSESFLKADKMSRLQYAIWLRRVKQLRKRAGRWGVAVAVVVWSGVQWTAFFGLLAVCVATGQYVVEVFTMRIFSVTFTWTGIVAGSGVGTWLLYKQLLRRKIETRKRRAEENETFAAETTGPHATPVGENKGVHIKGTS